MQTHSDKSDNATDSDDESDNDDDENDIEIEEKVERVENGVDDLGHLSHEGRLVKSNVVHPRRLGDASHLSINTS